MHLGELRGTEAGPVLRWRIRVRGVVQGVGYRPFVYQLAHGASLAGWVLNDPMGVLIEVQGPAERLASFVRALRETRPALAVVQDVTVEEGLRPDAGDAFTIEHSDHAGAPETIVPADSHVCADCLRELRDPADRRHAYPFINCTHCGPRFSIIQGLPYDRKQTTMHRFVMCEDCDREYRDPLDRRYHAQPVACPACGPRLTLTRPDGTTVPGPRALDIALDGLAAGLVVAVKSVGGFHLAVNARDAEAVARLRRRKRRQAKPFALMVADLAGAAAIAEVGDVEGELLATPARPIVLLRRRPGVLPDVVAPRNPNLGVMLASAPLHHLMLDRRGLDTLVMTSGNISGHPIAYRNETALTQLWEVADLVLHHDRDIEIRVDDSVVRTTSHPALPEPLITFFRRSRGYAPYPLEVAHDLAPIVAYGAELKTTVALSHGRRVYVSQHIGDLKNDETFASHRRTGEHLAGLHDLQPRYAACDLHPAMRSTRFALTGSGLPPVPVQHHHAHMASCMAENRVQGDALGVVFDGAGYGEDGTIWGGEFLAGGYAEVDRVAHLRPLPLLGGDAAVREPVRSGFALALDAFGDADAACAAFPALTSLDEQQRAVYSVMARRGLNAPLSSGMGRLFDAVAALLGVCHVAEYEAQGPIELEGLLERDLTAVDPYPYDNGDGAEIDPRPIVRAVAADLARRSLPEISRRFHSTVVSMTVAQCVRQRRRLGIDQVVLSGGVFLNEFLLVNCLIELRRAGFDAFCHRRVPTNDGGISLGQIMVADARLRRSATVPRQGLAALRPGAREAG